MGTPKYETREQEAQRQRSFQEWKRQVNMEVQAMSGLGCDDIGDANYWDEWLAGTSPQDMAHLALEEADFPFDE